MDELVLENERLIYFVMNKLHITYLRDEIYEVGMIGLVRASKTYSKEKGTFSTYACKCIQNEISHELSKINSKKRNYKTVSLSQPITEDEQMTLEDVIPSDVNIEKDILLKEQINYLYWLMEHVLSNDEKELIKRYYGLGKHESSFQKDLATTLHFSKTTINKRLKKALRKLKVGMWKYY